MTLNELTDILTEHTVVDDYSIKDDGIRFWMGARASNDAKQDVLNAIGTLDGVEVTREKVENGWEWFYVSLQHQN